MANLTLAIEDDILRAARIKAVQEGTSVNEICREAIARFIAPAVDSRDFISDLRAVVARLPKPARDERAWPGREALYDTALAERLPTLWAGGALSAPESAALAAAADGTAAQGPHGPGPA